MFVTRNDLQSTFLFRFELSFVNKRHSRNCLVSCLIYYVSMFSFDLISPVACGQV